MHKVNKSAKNIDLSVLHNCIQ